MPVRRGVVNTINGQLLDVLYADSNWGGIPVPPPSLGGNTSGYHVMPANGDGVAVHYETGAYPLTTTSYPVQAGGDAQPVVGIQLAQGESAQIHADGRVVGHLTNSNGTVLFSTTGGTSITIDVNGNIGIVAIGAITATGSAFHIVATGGLTVNGVGVNVP